MKKQESGIQEGDHMAILRVGIIGLGDIAQKVYLPLLAKEENWRLVGAFTPDAKKRKRICDQYRITPFHDLPSLAIEVDAAFVHSSTASHFEVVSYLLKAGVDVYVDKPLAATDEEAEELVKLSKAYNRKLMVGFNRRFAPLYVQAKKQAADFAWVRIEKHRENKVRDVPYETTMMDDYIHLVDLVRWFADDEPTAFHGVNALTSDKNLFYTNHMFQTEKGKTVYSGMHRRAGSNQELIELTSTDRIIRVKNLEIMETEEKGKIVTTLSPSWDTILKRRGFEGAVRHFFDAIYGDERPVIDGEEAWKTQMLMSEVIRKTPMVFREI